MSIVTSVIGSGTASTVAVAGPLRIAFEADSFPTGFGIPHHGELSTSWDDILWSAVTVGRPNRQYVFQHGLASAYEAIFRWALVRMALEQSGPHAWRLRRTMAAKTLDPSEKGAVNYFLGLAFCKLFSWALLDTPWLLHLDVFRPLLNPVLTSRSRPDLVGQCQASAEWHAFECKGRASTPDEPSRQKAKDQAMRLVSVHNTPCTLHVGAITYFRNDVLEFYWRDPPPSSSSEMALGMAEEPWRHYYEPIHDLIAERQSEVVPSLGTDPVWRIDEADLSVGVHPEILPLLRENHWDKAHDIAMRLFRSDESGRAAYLKGGSSRDERGRYKPDGIRVIAGERWLEPFKEP